MAHLRWDRGGEADLLELDGDRALLRSTISSAPGSRLDAVLASGTRVRVKIVRCRRVADEPAAFELHGRLLDATRDARAALLALVQETG